MQGTYYSFARPFNIKSGHYTSCSLWQQALWTSIKKAPWTHINDTKEFCTTNNINEFFTCNTNPTFVNLAIGWPHADWLKKIQALHEIKETMSTYKQYFFILWKTKSCYSWMSKETWTTCNMRHLYYQFTTRGFGKWACLVSIMITRLDLDASCNENGPSLSSNSTPYFLAPIIVKCKRPKHFLILAH